MYKKSFFILTASAGVVLLTSSIAFAETNRPKPFATSTRPVKQELLQNVSCVASAVEKRESSLSSGMTTLTAALNVAYSTRATALASAYSQSSADAIRTAVKTAWKSFSATVKSAKSAWNKSRGSAWMTFRTDLRACGSSSSLDDGTNAGADNEI